MCGIFLSVTRESNWLHPSPLLQERLSCRGPDSYETIKIKGHTPSPDDLGIRNDCLVLFCASVLSLRGSRIVTQPFVAHDRESFLLWNGEAWATGYQDIHDNDTSVIYSLLNDAVGKNKAAEDSSVDFVLEALKSIKGPFALVFYSSPNLYYARDSLGRRSLLLRSTPSSLELASVADGSSGWEEVGAGSVCCLRVHQTSGPEQITAGGSFDPITAKSLGLLSTDGSFNRTTFDGSGTLSNPGSPSVTVLHEYLLQSLKSRLSELPSPHHGKNDLDDNDPARVAVLFSGGLDCTVLARIAHDILAEEEPVDLLNVAFQNPRIHGTASSLASPYDACPDRQTARDSFAELRKICPTRQWRMIEINIPYDEYTAHRETIRSLMAPHNTEMDLSIASALYFAARGQGLLYLEPSQKASDSNSREIATSAKVLLSGLGADELFGGYQRHATAFVRHGVVGLLDELELDITRLGKRNCGRDDRVISHWSREVRYPYLDEDIVSWAIQEPVWNKCGFNLEDAARQSTTDIGPDKLILRLLARKLEMHDVSRKKKRAIQFGARTAKMEAGKRHKGTDVLV